MSDPDLTPQEPGVTADLDLPKLQAIQALAQGKIPGKLDELDDAELAMLRTLEVSAAKPRPVVLKAIDTVAGQRAADTGLDGSEIQGNSTANLGDRDSYAAMAGSEIDRSKLRVPVLSRDGWVLPLPRAEG